MNNIFTAVAAAAGGGEAAADADLEERLNNLRRDVNTSYIVLTGPFSYLGTEAAIAGEPELVLGHHRHLPDGVPLQGRGVHHDAGRDSDPLGSSPSPGPRPRPRPPEV